MWVMGGLDEDRNALATVEVYSPKTNSWRSCTPMRRRRDGAAAGVVGGRLVVAGGYCRGPLSSVEAYTGTGWTPLPPMPHDALLAPACVLNGRLHVMGGHDSNKHQVLEMTEENGLAWTVKAEMPATRIAAASVAHNDKIWVIGGLVDRQDEDENGAPGSLPTTSVLRYDPAADSWESAPRAQLPSADHAIGFAFELEGEVHYVGAGDVLRFRNGDWAVLPSDVNPRQTHPVTESAGSVLLG